MPKHYVTRLAAALRAGQGAERLYDEYGIALFGYCWAMLGDPAEAAGALTDTVLVATAHADALADPGDLTPWVYALARNECLRRRPDAPPAASPYRCDPYADVLTMLVARALTDLRPADRELIDLTVRYRLSVHQLARVLDLGEDRVARLAEIAVTRFDQTLSTLFMASSGRLAVPREIIADRPPLRVLLDLLPPARPPGELRGNIAAACVDPELDHYRQMVARRVLPLGEQGFPHRLDAERAIPPPASYGTRAMPLAAPVVTPVPPGERVTGGSPALEPVDADVIPADAVSRARTDAPAEPGGAEEADGARGPEARDGAGKQGAGPRRGMDPGGRDAGSGAAVEDDADAEPGARGPGRARRGRPRRTRGQRVRHALGVVLAVVAIALAVWAAQQIFAPNGTSGPGVAPSATAESGDAGAAPVPTAPSTSPSKSAGPSSWPTDAGDVSAVPPQAGPSSPGTGRRPSTPPGEVRPNPADPVPPTRHRPPRTRPPWSHPPDKPPTGSPTLSPTKTPSPTESPSPAP